MRRTSCLLSMSKMKKEYIETLKLLDNLDYIPTLLLHSCCAPCSSYVISFLDKYFDITVLYYNPNIYPKEEYEKRKKEQIRFINDFESKNKLSFIDGDYDEKAYFNYMKEKTYNKEGDEHCYLCYKYRIEKTAQIAKAKGYDYFTTTLSVSPYKNSLYINEIGKYLEEKYQLKFLRSDFKKDNGYKKSIELSKQYNLYRQNYCGCIYSFNNMKKENLNEKL